MSGLNKNKPLSSYSLDELDKNFVVVRNIECGYVLGLLPVKDADELFKTVEDSFPLDTESIISEEVQDCIDEDRVLSKDSVFENIYENMDLDGE